MDIQQLRYFLLMGTSKSFSAAAKTAFTSRQNLTKSIHQLERELGVQLFIRVGNEMALTYDGERVFDAAGEIVKRVDELSTMFTRMDEGRKLNCGVAFNTSYLFPQVNIANFGDFPICVSEHRASSCYDLLVKGELDIAIIVCMERSFSHCTSTLISSSPFLFLCSEASQLARHEVIKMHDLEGHDLILLPSSQLVYQHFLESYRKLALPNSEVREIMNVSLMIDEVLNNDAVAIVDEACVARLPKGAVTRPCKNPHFQWNLYILSRNTPAPTSIEHALINRAKMVIPPQS